MESFKDLFAVGESTAKFTTCTVMYPDGAGGWYPVRKITFDRPTYNPGKMELSHKMDDMPIGTTKIRNPTFWQKSFNRARQTAFDLLMCNPDLDTFLTFTVDPARFDSYDYNAVCKYLSVWLDNRVRRNGLKYILVPERHKSGAIHFHGLGNRRALRLVSSGRWNWGKYQKITTATLKRVSGEERPDGAQEIYNLQDLALGFSTALHIVGEDAQTKISKYIWKYMTKQQGAMIGGRFYLHGGDLLRPRCVYTDESIEDAISRGGTLVSYGGISCALETVNRV